MPDEVLITSDATKLPPDIAALLDPAVPLPGGTAYFEKRYDLADLLKALWISLVLIILALVAIPLGIGILFDHNPQTGVSVSLWPLGFGVVCGFAAWFMLASIWTRWKFRQQQLAGECTRRGIFLTPDALVQAYEFDTTVIPRGAFVELSGNDVKYRHNEMTKSFRLPAALVGDTPDRLHSAIQTWTRQTTPLGGTSSRRV